MIKPGRPQALVAALLLLATLALLLPAACRLAPGALSLSTAAATTTLVFSEMHGENSTLWSINPASFQDKRSLGDLPHQNGFPLKGSISPDNRLMVLVQLPPGTNRFSGARLLIMNTDGSGQRLLEDGVDYDNVPVWSPDGRELAFVKRAGQATPPAGSRPGAEAAPGAPPAAVYAIGADGKNRRLLFSEAQALDLYLVGWHNDGKRLIYRRFTTSGDQLSSFDMSTGQPQTLTTLSKAPAYGVHLSPDGKNVVASVRQDNSYNVVAESLDGQNVQVLNQGNLRPSNPVYDADGRRVAFDTEPRQQGASVGIMETGADTVTRLSSPDVGKEVPLFFSPDGEWVVVRHHQDGRARVFILRAKDGAKQYLETPNWVEPVGWTKG